MSHYSVDKRSELRERWEGGLARSPHRDDLALRWRDIARPNSQGLDVAVRNAAGEALCGLVRTRATEPEEWGGPIIHKRAEAALVLLAEAIDDFGSQKLFPIAVGKLALAEMNVRRALEDVRSGWAPDTRVGYRGQVMRVFDGLDAAIDVLARIPAFEGQGINQRAEARDVFFGACEEAVGLFKYIK